ncbi:aspartic acid-rich protein aspolin2-1-like protein [Reticulomyxa filosa]|uniref:Aspartic acid-rich protein aspolin2-1-like protein n=1 Tax=Reticulomyxa filosa TaxID=46433 RepID=X6NTP3_RETFI|nr:aspartic acid-rich protein aspolin2-1-like protein [Reticulomyxa filosa]|eukprot:ETO29323.1 aspartic acid-rich protein aspolin2-1-like protein [Reticulomyxa filosa]
MMRKTDENENEDEDEDNEEEYGDEDKNEDGDNDDENGSENTLLNIGIMPNTLSLVYRSTPGVGSFVKYINHNCEIQRLDFYQVFQCAEENQDDPSAGTDKCEKRKLSEMENSDLNTKHETDSKRHSSNTKKMKKCFAVYWVELLSFVFFFSQNFTRIILQYLKFLFFNLLFLSSFTEKKTKCANTFRSNICLSVSITSCKKKKKKVKIKQNNEKGYLEQTKKLAPKKKEQKNYLFFFEKTVMCK